MEDATEAEFSIGMGGPGPEDFVSAAALLSAALAREAQIWSQTALSIRSVVEPVDAGLLPSSTASRQTASSIALNAAVYAAGLTAMAANFAQTSDEVSIVLETVEATKALGVIPRSLASQLRSAALQLQIDDAAVRVAASIIADRVAKLLAQY